MYFRYFVIISLGKGLGPSFEYNWIPFTQGCFVSSFVKIGPVIFVSVFSIFSNYIPLEMGLAFYFNKLESPLPKYVVAIGQVVLE